MKNIVATMRAAIRSRRPVREYERIDQAPTFRYEDGEILDVVVESTMALRRRLQSEDVPRLDPATTRTLLIMHQARGVEPLEVLDFGGGCGEMFFWMNELLPHGIAGWSVIETKEMVRRGMAHFAEPKLRFHESVDEATARTGRCDLLILSGALQYLANPEQVLERMLDCGARCLYLTRTMVTTDGRTVITEQSARLIDHGPPVGARQVDSGKRVTHPIVLIPEETVLSLLSDRYVVEILFDESPSVSHRTTAGTLNVRSFGLFARRKADPE